MQKLVLVLGDFPEGTPGSRVVLELPDEGFNAIMDVASRVAPTNRAFEQLGLMRVLADYPDLDKSWLATP